MNNLNNGRKPMKLQKESIAGCAGEGKQRKGEEKEKGKRKGEGEEEKGKTKEKGKGEEKRTVD